MPLVTFTYRGSPTFLAVTNDGEAEFRLFLPGREVVLNSDIPWVARAISIASESPAPSSAPDELPPILGTIKDSEGASLAGSLFAVSVNNTGGTKNIRYSVTGIPEGDIDEKTGIIRTALSAPGTYPITITATNSAGSDSVTFSLQVGTGPTTPPDTTAPAIALLNGPITGATTGTPLSFTLRLTDAGGLNPSTITLDKFLVRNPADQVVARTINATGPDTQKDVEVTLTPGGGTAGTYEIAVAAGITDAAGNALSPVDPLATFTVAAPAGFGSVAPNSTPTIFVMGQSNADVQDADITLPAFTGVRRWNTTNKVFDNFLTTATTTTSALILRVIESYKAQFPGKELNIVWTNTKTYQGGTTFGVGAGQWGQQRIGSTGFIRDNAYLTVKDVFDHAIANSLTINPIFLWVHGEDDSGPANGGANNGAWSQTYGEQLSLISPHFYSLREQMNELAGFETPWVISKLSNDTPYTYKAVTRSEQEAVAASSNLIEIVETNGLPTQDGIHYTTAAHTTLGPQLFSAMDTLAMPELVSVGTPALALPAYPQSARSIGPLDAYTEPQIMISSKQMYSSSKAPLIAQDRTVIDYGSDGFIPLNSEGALLRMTGVDFASYVNPAGFKAVDSGGLRVLQTDTDIPGESRPWQIATPESNLGDDFFAAFLIRFDQSVGSSRNYAINRNNEAQATVRTQSNGNFDIYARNSVNGFEYAVANEAAKAGPHTRLVTICKTLSSLKVRDGGVEVLNDATVTIPNTIQARLSLPVHTSANEGIAFIGVWGATVLPFSLTDDTAIANFESTLLTAFGNPTLG